MSPRILPAIAACAMPQPKTGSLLLPQTDLGAHLSRISEQPATILQGPFLTREIATEFRSLAKMNPAAAHQILRGKLADSFPQNFGFVPGVSTYTPELARYTTDHRVKKIDCDFDTGISRLEPEALRHTLIAQPKGTQNLVLGNWHNQAGLFQLSTGNNLFTAAALMLIDERDLVAFFRCVDTGEDFDRNLARLYQAQFDREEGITRDTDWRCTKSATKRGQIDSSTEEVSFLPKGDLIYSAEPFHAQTQGAIFLRDISDYFPNYMRQDSDDEPCPVFLLGILNFGDGELTLSLPFQVAMQHALQNNAILKSVPPMIRSIAMMEMDDNLATMLEATKRDNLMWAEEAIMGNTRRHMLGLAPHEMNLDMGENPNAAPVFLKKPPSSRRKP